MNRCPIPVAEIPAPIWKRMLGEFLDVVDNIIERSERRIQSRKPIESEVRELAEKSA
jgi:hypothetical protein